MRCFSTAGSGKDSTHGPSRQRWGRPRPSLGKAVEKDKTKAKERKGKATPHREQGTHELNLNLDAKRSDEKPRPRVRKALRRHRRTHGLPGTLSLRRHQRLRGGVLREAGVVGVDMVRNRGVGCITVNYKLPDMHTLLPTRRCIDQSRPKLRLMRVQ